MSAWGTMAPSEGAQFLVILRSKKHADVRNDNINKWNICLSAEKYFTGIRNFSLWDLMQHKEVIFAAFAFVVGLFVISKEGRCLESCLFLLQSQRGTRAGGSAQFASQFELRTEGKLPQRKRQQSSSGFAGFYQRSVYLVMSVGCHQDFK